MGDHDGLVSVDLQQFITGCAVSLLFGIVATYMVTRSSGNGGSNTSSASGNKGASGAGAGAGAGAAESSGDDDDVDGLEECKMVFVVRTDLKMQKGKIAAQCGHATIGAYKRAVKQAPQYVKAWETYGQTKVALKVTSEEDMDALAARAKTAGLPHYIVVDAGRTQIDPGSRTVLGIGPAPVSEVNKITRHLKLL